MSKERRFGLDKWRLGKVLADYKEHKKKKKAGGYLSYEDETQRHKAKRKYPCKQLKGAHYFEVVKKKDMKTPYLSEVLLETRCVGCGKRNYKLVKPEEAKRIHSFESEEEKNGEDFKSPKVRGL